MIIFDPRPFFLCRLIGIGIDPIRDADLRFGLLERLAGLEGGF